MDLNDEQDQLRLRGELLDGVHTLPQARALMQYDAANPRCGNCSHHHRSERVSASGAFFVTEISRHCKLAGFATNDGAVCALWTRRPASKSAEKNK